MKFLKLLADKYMEIIGAIVIVSLIYLFLFYKKENVEKDGLITIAKVLRSEPSGDGSSLYIEIYFKDKTYSTTLNLSCEGQCVGNYYFIRINKAEPTDYPIFFEDKKVPDCILSSVKYFKGWIDFPTCKNF